MKYSWKIGLKKTAITALLFLLPVLIDQFIIKYPEIAQITVGGILVFIANFLKVKYGK